MAAEPTVFSNGTAIAVATAAIQRGRSPEELCRELGLPAAKLADPRVRMPHGLVVRVWEELSCGVDDFGLQAAKMVGRAGQSLVEYAVLNAPDVRSALGTFVSLKHLIHDAAAHSLEVTAAGAALRLALAPPLRLPNALWDFLTATIVERVCALLGESGAPSAISLPRGPFLDEQAARAVLRAKITYRSPPSVRWPRAVLDRPIPGHDPRLYALLTRQLDAAADSPMPLPGVAEGDLIVELRRSLRAAVLRGDASIDATARQLRTSTRSLQRRLGERGTSFGEQLDDARRSVALALLAEPGATVKSAALTSGFSQAAAFSRAFRRWTGSAPAAWLRGRRAGA